MSIYLVPDSAQFIYNTLFLFPLYNGTSGISSNLFISVGILNSKFSPSEEI